MVDGFYFGDSTLGGVGWVLWVGVGAKVAKRVIYSFGGALDKD